MTDRIAAEDNARLAAELAVLNSMTKYPSIPTHHTLNPKNGTLDGPATRFAGQVIGTEKLDGTNCRVIVFPHARKWMIGSREELLHARGDLIANPALGIVAAVRDTAEAITEHEHFVLTVYYGEVYGAGVGKAARQYADGKQVGFRLFDVAVYPDFDDMQTWPRERIAAWRDNGGQEFLTEDDLARRARTTGVDLTPRLFTFDATDLPTEVDKMRDFLAEHMPHTLSALGDTEPGRSEGIVLRSHDRSLIAKARFEDYDRTLRRLGSRR